MIEVKKSVAVLVPVYLVKADGTPATGILYSSVTAAVMKSDGTMSVITVTSPDWTEKTTGAFASQGIYTLLLPTSAVNTQGILVYVLTNSGDAKVYRGAVKVVTNEEVDTKTVVDTIAADYTGARAAKIDNLDVVLSTRASSTALATVATAVGTVGTAVGVVGADVLTVGVDVDAMAAVVDDIRTDYTTVRAAKLDNIDATLAATRADYTTLRAAKLDNLDAAVTTRASGTDLATLDVKVSLLQEVALGKWKVEVSGPDANRLILYDTSDVVIQKFDLFDSAGDPTSIAFFSREPI